jgi:UDP-N-acetyl-D-glucosamine dehydrogenase
MLHPPYQICIIGLGYVGLPLARLFIEKGHTVYGVDVDAAKIEKLQKRLSYLSDFSRSDIKQMFARGTFHPGTSYEAVRRADVILLCVPTPLNEREEPDLSYIVQAVEQSLPYLRQGQLIVLESSTYPGTVNEVVRPLVESAGLKIGEDLSLAYSPERIDPGSHWKLEDIPKVVGGCTPVCTEYARSVYGSVFKQVVVVSSPAVAEMTKLLENSQRFINISFMNSLLQLCEELNINLWEAIEAARTKPYGFTPYYPGPGVGGHCIPVDPLYLLWKARQHNINLPFIELSRQVNHAMPDYVVAKIRDVLAPKPLSDCQLLIIGVTYKKDVNDIRESPAPVIMEKLAQAGARVSYHDPYVNQLQIGRKVYQNMPLTQRNMRRFDCTVILTDHSNLPYEQLIAHSRLVVDTRNVTGNLPHKGKVVLL